MCSLVEYDFGTKITDDHGRKCQTSLVPHDPILGEHPADPVGGRLKGIACFSQIDTVPLFCLADQAFGDEQLVFCIVNAGSE